MHGAPLPPPNPTPRQGCVLQSAPATTVTQKQNVNKQKVGGAEDQVDDPDHEGGINKAVSEELSRVCLIM